MARRQQGERGSFGRKGRDFEFSGPPQIGGGLGLAGLLKLAGYGDDRNELDQYKLLVSLMQNQAENKQKQAEFGLKTQTEEREKGAAQLKGQIDWLDLQRKLQDMQQEGQTGQLNALVELAKTGDKTAIAALSKASPAYAQAKAGEQDYANRWEAGKMEGELAQLYQGGKAKDLSTYMSLQNPNFAANPELAKLIDWQKLAQQWPVDPATPRPGVMAGEPTAPAVPGGGPSAMPGQIDPDMVRLVNQQNAPPARVGQVPSEFRYGTGTMEVPQVAQPTGSGMSLGNFLAATVPGSGMSSPEAIRAALQLFQTREAPSAEPYRVGY